MTRWLTYLLEAGHAPRYWLVRHGLYWVVFTVVLSVLWMYWYGSFGQTLATVVVHILPQVVPVTYLFLYGVLPALIRQHYRSFAVRLVGWLLVFLLFRLWLIVGPWPLVLSQTAYTANPLRVLFDTGFMLCNNFVFVAATLKLFRHQYQTERTNHRIARQLVQMELQTLASQVHPHCLFNTLNNLYSLTLRQSEQAAEVAHRLTALFRYILRECNVPLVPLHKELELIQNFVQLEQIRYGHRLDLTLDVQGDFAGTSIPPLLLIPFVENAFKHGTAGRTERAFVHLAVRAEGPTLRFHLENSRDATLMAGNDLYGGLGLTNVQQRLTLLFPNRHRLSIQAGPTRYVVDLDLTLTAPRR